MLKDISAGWKTSLENGKDTRFYFDPRQQVYPSIAGSPTFTELTSWNYGSHDFTGGYAEYMYTCPTKFSFEVKVYPNFAYDTADIQGIFSWYVDASNSVSLYYNAGDDKFKLYYEAGGTAVMLSSNQFDDGTAHTDINQWLRFSGWLDTTSGAVTGSALYVNDTLHDDEFAAAAPAMVENMNLLQVRARNSVAGDYKISYFRLFPDHTATATDIGNHFKDVYNEEIFFGFNGIALAKTRCNITQFVSQYSYAEKFQKNNGSFCANTASLTLINEGITGATGCFCDDQYAAFTPESYQYNGTSSQKYLQNRIPVYIESWYGDDFDSVFVGKVNEGAFPRSKVPTALSRVSISCEDSVSDIARKTKKRAVYYDSYDLCDTASESTSLIHVITRLATKEEVYNYLANSSFENATITDSWSEGANCTLSRDATYELVGTYCGKAVFTGAGSFYQVVTFTDIAKINVGESYTFSLYIRSGAAFEGDIKISEYDSVGSNDSTSAAVSLAGTEGYEKFTVTHTITDEDSDRLRFEILSDAADTIYFDCAMGIKSGRDYNYFVLNDNDGAAGVESADDADSDSYDTVGFIVDSYDIEHPWVRIEQGESLWEHLKDIANATPNLHYFGMDATGNLEYSHTASAAGDPASEETITDVNGVATILEPIQANKIIISGVKIVEFDDLQTVWNAKIDSGIESEYSNTWMLELTNGEVFPDTTTYPEYWAKIEVL